MPRSMRPLCVALVVLLAAGCVTAVAGHDAPDNAIVVSGTGRVSVAPDIAQLTVGVESQTPTLAEATADAARRMSAVVARIKELGIPDADIATVAYSVEPRTASTDPGRRDPPRIVGYHITNLVQVTVRKPADAGSILDAAVTAGANAVRGIRFTLADSSAAQAQARKHAVADALAKARQLATAAGVIPGQVLSIRESGAPPPMPMRTMSFSAAATPIEPGQLEIAVTVELRQAIK